MSDLDTLRALLYSRNIDSTNVKPYTGFRFGSSGDLVLSTPSLDSYRVNKDPLYPYEGNLSSRVPKDVDHRILSYNSLEHRRYQSLHVKKPFPHNVTRIYDERFGNVPSLRSDPSKTVLSNKSPGYRLILDQLPTQSQTMVSQRFNKINPFVTEPGVNPHSNPMLRESAV